MPIVMSKDEWSRITRWTDQDREDPDVVRRREYVRYLDVTSNEMTKHWPNSLENVNKRNEELRRARIEAAEKANSTFYKRYLKRQKEEQERLMYSARDIVFKNKDAPKLMLSAVIETCIQKERQEQLKFLGELRKQAADQKRKDDDEIIRKAKEWEQLIKTKKKRRFDENKQHQRDILDQAHEISEKNRKAYEDELNMQKLDNIKANQQMEALKEFEDNFNEEEKARIWADMDQAKRENEARRAEQAARDLMDDRLLNVLLRSRARVEKRRKQTEIDVKAEKQRVLDKISAKLESGDAAREAKEQAILDKAIKEKDDIAAAKRESQAKRAAALRKERTDAREKWLRDEERRLQEFNNAQQWECMNRFKNLELYEDYKEKLRKENERKIKEFREDTLRLWKERDDRVARELAETRYFYGELAEQKLRDADNKLLTHAAELLQEARDNGRPEYALHEAIDRYCKLYRLYPMPDLPASLAEHFRRYAPWDGSRPDADYVTLPPPPPDRGPDAPDEDVPSAAGTGRNGLNDPINPTTSKTSNKKKEESVADYKRAGRANGLQRRPGLHDLTLPPITVVPCRNETCRCELKE